LTVSVGYVAVADEILASGPGAERRPELARRRLVRRGDELLRRLEQLNLDAYTPARAEQPEDGGRRVVRLPADLAQDVNDLRVEVGLAVRRLRTTADGLDAIWAAQRRVLGQPDEPAG
jgi:hypothetical protein